MLPGKGYKAYKQYWEDQAALDQSPWDQDKVLRLTILTDYDSNLKELQFSNHSLKIKDRKHLSRLKVPYNYQEVDSFESKSHELLGIKEHWLTDISLESSHCFNR